MADPLKLHAVNVGPNGTFRQSGDFATTPDDIDALFAHLDDEGVDKLALHFHGGLISEATGLDIARGMIDVYRAGGAHPVTFVWETGVIETVRNNLGSLNDTTLFTKLVDYGIRHVAKRAGVSIGGRGPGAELSLAEIEEARARDADFEEIEAGARAGTLPLDEADLEAMRPEMEVDIEIDLEADDELRAALAEDDETGLLSPPPEADPQARGILEMAWVAKAVAAIAFRTLRRFLRQRDHGVIATVVEETLREAYLADLGAWVWGGMKDIAEAMWLPNTDPIGPDDHVGTYFLDGLAALQRRRPLAVDLVGHSAGSIAIARMLSAAGRTHPDLRFRHVVFLAPAATCEVFNDHIGPAADRFDDFRMFTMSDEAERADRLVSGVYPHSLLYFISGVLEGEADTPICGLERHVGNVAPYDTPPGSVTHAFVGSDGRLVLSPTREREAGFSSGALSHGDFDEDPLTRASLTAIVGS